MRKACFLLLFAGCAQVDEGEYAFDKKDLKNPDKTLEIFKELVRRGDTAKAYDYLLSKKTKSVLSKEEFQIALSMYEIIPRLLAGLDNHGVDAENGTMRICNPEFGITRAVGIRPEIGGRIWTLEFTREDLAYFQEQALVWFRKQTEAAGHRLHVYPPNWRYAYVQPHCGCKSNG
jgi:hypothetical protein